LNLTEETDPKKVERDLCEQFARDLWTDTSHRLVLHGRYVCLARKPKCDRCALNEVCASRESEPAGTWSQRAAWERVVVESWGRDDPTD
jgi:endonuclease-3